jgi:hypothetical protein
MCKNSCEKKRVVNVFLWWRCLRRGGGRSGFFFRLPFLAGLSSHDLSLEPAESHARRRGFQLRGQSLLGLGIFLVFYGVMYQNRNVRASRTSTVLTATPFESLEEEARLRRRLDHLYAAWQAAVRYLCWLRLPRA